MILPLLGVHYAAGMTFFVSPTGNDGWSGAYAGRHGSQGPFATLGRALAAVRSYRGEHPHLSESIRIELRGGVYRLDAPVTMTPEASGTPTSHTVIEAYRQERPVFEGGSHLSMSEEYGRWVVQVQGFRPGQLFVNGERRNRPRWPRAGYSIVDRTAPSTPDLGNRGFNRFGYADNDVRPDWSETGEAEVLVFHLWTMDRLPLASVDPVSKTVTLGGHCNAAAYSSLNKGSRYIVENIPDPARGEWYLNFKSGHLEYVPLQNEAKVDVVAPKIDTLLDIEGDPAAHRWVENVDLKGLGFRYSAYQLPTTGHAFPQADVDVGAAIEAIGARNCSFQRLSLGHTGGWGIAFHKGCQNDRLESSYLSDLGAGGVKIGETDMPADPEEVASNITVENCRIEHGGRIHPAATGVWIGQSPFDTVSSCTISDFYYTGISVGWSWGYGKSLTHDIHISNNRIEHIGQEVLSDMGGIYTLGLEPGTRLFHNWIRDVNGFYYGGWGIYPDEGTSNMEVSDNLVQDCKTGCFHQHYGADNEIHNNIFYHSAEVGVIIRTRAEDHLSLRFDHNIVVSDGVPLLASNWSGNGFDFESNIYWNTKPGPADFGGKSWDSWRQAGQDRNSLFADPKFKNATAGDFDFQQGSAALSVGFKPFDTKHFGSDLPEMPAQASKPAFPVFMRKLYPQNIG